MASRVRLLPASTHARCSPSAPLLMRLPVPPLTPHTTKNPDTATQQYYRAITSNFGTIRLTPDFPKGREMDFTSVITQVWGMLFWFIPTVFHARLEALHTDFPSPPTACTCKTLNAFKRLRPSCGARNAAALRTLVPSSRTQKQASDLGTAWFSPRFEPCGAYEDYLHRIETCLCRDEKASMTLLCILEPSLKVVVHERQKNVHLYEA